MQARLSRPRETAATKNKVERVGQSRRPFTVPNDFVEFAAQCQIRSRSSYVPFKLFDYQIEFAKLLSQHRRFIVYKTRQLGLSETCACKMLHRSLLNPAYSGVTLSIGQDESSKIAERVKAMPLLPNFDWQYASTQQLKANGCGTLLFRPSTDNAVRSLPSVTDLFFDEAAFIKGIRELYSGATPAQKMAGDDAKTMVVSTMSEEGQLSWFWEVFASDTPSHIDIDHKMAHVREGKGEYGAGFDWWIDDAGWCKVLIHWKSHPIYCLQTDYLERTKREEKLTDDKLNREYNLEVPKEGASLFSIAAIDKAAIGQWGEPQHNRYYLLCTDPNFGGSDYWVTQVWDISEMPFSLVAEYRENNQSPSKAEQETGKLVEAYRPVLASIEGNSGGKAHAERIAIKYPWLQVETVITTATSKRVNTDRIALAVEQGEVVFPPDWQGIGEAKRFSAQKREAVTGHDDCLMCWAAGWAHLETALGMTVNWSSTTEAIWSY